MADEAPKPKLKPDEELEAAAQKTGYSVHPIISRITHRLGAFNIIRNAKNEREVEIDKVMEGS